MNPTPLIKVLLVEDDEDDFILARDMLKSITLWRFELDWIRTYEAGLQAAVANRHDVCLVDYRLGPQNGVELISAALAGGCQSPLILLTGMGQAEVDLAAMRAGAADYLDKSRLDARELERAIRYALERRRAAAQAAFDQARLAAFGAEVGLTLTQCDPLERILERCAGALVQYLNGALAQISVYSPEQRVLIPRASAGPLLNASALATDLPAVALDAATLREGRPVLVKDLAADRRFGDPAWARQHGVVAFAAHPLLLQNQLVGLMALYSTTALTDVTLQEMASVAHGVALCIGYKQSEHALQLCQRRYRAVVENIHEVVFQLNEFGHWTFLNPAWERATGFGIQEAVGSSFLDYIHPDDREQNERVFLDLIERRVDSCRYEARLLTRDGQCRRVAIYAELALNPDGTVLGISGNFCPALGGAPMRSPSPAAAPAVAMA